MFKTFSKTKTIKTDQDRLIYLVERIVNITIVKTERANNESVKETLKDLESIFRKFLELRKNNPDKFDNLLWSKDFFDRYIKQDQKSKTVEIEDSKEIKTDEELKQEISFQLWFAPEEQLRGLTQFLNSFRRIWQSAVKSKNQEISRYSVNQIIYLLDELTKEKENQIFIEQFLKLLDSIAKELIDTPQDPIDASARSAAFKWYTYIVFGYSSDGDRFLIEYLQLFNRYFFNSVAYIIYKEQKMLFKTFVSAIVEGINIPLHQSGKIFDYQSIIRADLDNDKYNEIEPEVRNSIEKLYSSENKIDFEDDLLNWIKEHDELFQLISSNVSEKQKTNLNRMAEDIDEYIVSKYKYERLLELTFSVGAYCLFKRNLEFIKILLEYKQPPDSDATWVGHDIVPTSLNEVMDIFYKGIPFQDYFSFKEGHHGTIIYKKRYFILLLMAVLKALPTDEKGNCPEITNYRIPDLPIVTLGSLDTRVDQLSKAALDLQKDEGLLQFFEYTNTAELFNNRFKILMEKIKENTQEQIDTKEIAQQISKTKLKEFEEEFIEKFYSAASIRGIFKYYDLINDISDQAPQKKWERVGINTVSDKAPFFEKWHISYGGRGEFYGRSLAEWENQYILKAIKDYCTKLDDRNIDYILQSFDRLSCVIIIAPTNILYDYFHESKKFIPKWRYEDSSLKVESFEGWYHFQKQKIPIFISNHLNLTKEIMFLDSSRLGELIQHSPLNEGEDPTFKKDIFFIRVQAFSQDEILTQSLLKETPKWLSEIGTEDEQKRYLQKKVLLQIFERFEFQKHDNFVGYILTSKNLIT